MIHCKSGVDRTGLMGAPVLSLMRGGTADDALKQFGWRYGYIGARADQASARALVLALRRGRMPQRGRISCHGPRSKYDPAGLEAGFRPRPSRPPWSISSCAAE